MLDLFGKGYVFEHILFAIQKERDELSYRIYVTDGLKAVNDNLSAYLGGGVVLRDRYYDLVKKKKPKDTRTAEEVAEDIVSEMGLTFEERRESE